MRVKRYFAPHLIHELLRCYASLRFAPVGAEQTSTGCLAPRNSTHIRNPLIFQGKSQGHQSKIDDSSHVCGSICQRFCPARWKQVPTFWPLFHLFLSCLILQGLIWGKKGKHKNRPYTMMKTNGRKRENTKIARTQG